MPTLAHHIATAAASKGPPTHINPRENSMLTHSEDATAERMAHEAYSAAKRLKDWLKANPGDHSHAYMAIQDAQLELDAARYEIRKQRDEAFRAAEKAGNSA